MRYYRLLMTLCFYLRILKVYRLAEPQRSLGLDYELGTIQVLRHHVFDFFRPTHPTL